MSEFQIGIMVACGAAATILTRFLPFWLFGTREPPRFVLYLGRTLPPAVMAMLVVFCLKDAKVLTWPFGIPEILGVAITAGLYLWRKNMLLCVIVGTASYMALLQFVFPAMANS
ncbi:MAG: branched-chain amino acid transporter permease [Propionibacteriaceae bacterium]|jgi:branched-subunit amino acid transport protein AzlD|nr:branched-chain amino acid transporter permease [Propionibacteriaceae bacterium]